MVIIDMKLAVAGSTGLVGSQLVARAREAGHELVELSRSAGCDVATSPDLAGVLDGCEAVIDVLQCADLEEGAATHFFTRTSSRLGMAADLVGARTVVLSIIGVDRAAGPGADPARSSTEGYYRAKLAQESAAREHGGDVHVVRSAQFHNFVGQVLGRAAESVVAEVLDMPVQPVEVDVAVATLLELAAGARSDPLLEVAGPKVERLPDLAREFADYYFDAQQIEARRPWPALAQGLLLPSSGAIIGGRTFHAWLHGHSRG